MNHKTSPFKWRHDAPDIIPLCVRRCRPTGFPIESSQDEKFVPQDCRLRRVKCLNNVAEQDRRFIKKKVRASQCFESFHAAERTPEGIESINMMRKGQVKRLAGSDARGQARFVSSLFRIAA